MCLEAALPPFTWMNPEISQCDLIQTPKTCYFLERKKFDFLGAYLVLRRFVNRATPNRSRMLY